MTQLLDPSICIEDAEGNRLFGAGNSRAEKYPIEFEGEVLGWVIGGKHSAEVAALVAQSAAKESEIKSLANEVLGLYREINLLYNLSEKLAASLELGPVAQLALSQARTLIKATDGLVMLVDETSRQLESVAAFGNESQISSCLACVDLIIDVVAQSGKADRQRGARGPALRRM